MGEAVVQIVKHERYKPFDDAEMTLKGLFMKSGFPLAKDKAD